MAMAIDYSAFTARHPKFVSSPLTNLPPSVSGLIGPIIIGTVLAIFLVPVDMTILIVLFTLIVLSHFVWFVLALPFLLFGLIYVEIRLFLKLTVGGARAAVEMSNFAVANGFTFDWGARIDANGQPSYDVINFKGVLGGQVGPAHLSNNVRGSYNGINFGLYVLLSAHGIYTICEIDLPVLMPHIYLNNDDNNHFFNSLSSHFTADERIHLEGDFDKHFRTYTKVSPDDTLAIVTPDVMAILIDSVRHIDVELVDDRLYLIGGYHYMDAALAKTFFDALDGLMPKLRRQVELHAPIAPSA